MEMNIPHITSDDRVMSEEQINNALKKKGGNSAKESSNFEMPE
jgi:hypothetical protein